MLLGAGCLNAGLGWYLVRTGRRVNSMILEADGKHVLTDSWTSFGVVIGLVTRPVVSKTGVKMPPIPPRSWYNSWLAT
jgi:divalent metal cation (Fe/Co/Zn/Cd) transporter